MSNRNFKVVGHAIDGKKELFSMKEVAEFICERGMYSEVHITTEENEHILSTKGLYVSGKCDTEFRGELYEYLLPMRIPKEEEFCWDNVKSFELPEMKEKQSKKEEPMSDYLAAVLEKAEGIGFEFSEYKGHILFLNLNGKFAGMIDESGSMMYHPYDEVFLLMEEMEQMKFKGKKVEHDEGQQMELT